MEMLLLLTCCACVSSRRKVASCNCACVYVLYVCTRMRVCGCIVCVYAHARGCVGVYMYAGMPLAFSLTLRKFVSDICVCMFCVCEGIGFVD